MGTGWGVHVGMKGGGFCSTGGASVLKSRCFCSKKRKCLKKSKRTARTHFACLSSHVCPPPNEWQTGPQLKVMLLSGRSWSQIFDFQEFQEGSVRSLLGQCAYFMNLDPDEVMRNGTLMRGTAEIKDLKDLEEGQAHEVTLVLT